LLIHCFIPSDLTNSLIHLLTHSLTHSLTALWRPDAATIKHSLYAALHGAFGTAFYTALESAYCAGALNLHRLSCYSRLVDLLLPRYEPILFAIMYSDSFTSYLFTDLQTFSYSSHLIFELQPTRQPVGVPSAQPSRQPSTQPSGTPSTQPSR
jgi:hypothetical protein